MIDSTHVMNTQRTAPAQVGWASRALAATAMVLSAPAALMLWPWMHKRRKPLMDAQGRCFLYTSLAPRNPWAAALARVGLAHLFGPAQAVLRGHMTWVGGSARTGLVPAHGLPAGVITPARLRARTGIDFSQEAALDAEYAYQRSAVTDIGIALRYALVSLWGSSSRPGSQTVRLGPVQVDNLSQGDAVQWILRRLDSGAFLAPSQLSFINAHCVNIAHQDEAYLHALACSDLALADGMGLRLAGQILGQPLRDNVNGTDLIEPLCAALALGRHRVFFLGGQPGVAEAAAAALKARYPGLKVAGSHHGFFAEVDTDEVMRRVRKAGTDLLIVAMGVPRQEIFIAEHLSASGAHLAMGVGGLFDFLSNRIRRAPGWVRELGMEWAWRLLQEPGRMWRRYLLGNFTFLTRVLFQRLTRA